LATFPLEENYAEELLIPEQNLVWHRHCEFNTRIQPIILIYAYYCEEWMMQPCQLVSSYFSFDAIL